MRRIGKWVLTLGIITGVQASGYAGPFDGLFQSRQTEQTAPQASKSVNQQAAEAVARNLKAQNLTTKNVRIAYSGGTVTLTGMVLNVEQKARAHRAALASPGVQQVNNQLVLMQQTAAPQKAPAFPTESRTQTAQRPTANPFSNAAFQSPAPNRGRIQQTAGQQPDRETPKFSQADYTEESVSSNNNQAVAEEIARALGGAGLNGYDIEISYQDGQAELSGTVADREQWAAAGQAASQVAGVQQVSNKLSYAGAGQQAGQPQQPTPQQIAAQQQYIAQMRYLAAQRYAAQQAAMRAYQQGQPGQVPPANPAGPLVPGQGGPAAPPAYGHPGAGSRPVSYNQPNLPEYAWPAYANYPNSAQISYPTQYSASAWPYIGPFYPYPQVPLGWRKAQLEWDDGYWKLNFNSRTDRWWWFVNPRNW